MPELGTKFECFHCGARFYDLGRPEPICPKCGANQKDAKKQQEANHEAAQAKRRRREEVVRVPEEEEDLLAPGAGEDEFGDEEIEKPEGVGEEDEDKVEEELDDEE